MSDLFPGPTPAPLGADDGAVRVSLPAGPNRLRVVSTADPEVTHLVRWNGWQSFASELSVQREGDPFVLLEVRRE